MSIFGTDYQRGFNAARDQQSSEQVLSVLNQRREQNWVQGQFQALQVQLQAVQLENMRLQQENARLHQENARYERFANWAMNTIDEQNERIADLQSDLNKWVDLALR